MKSTQILPLLILISLSSFAQPSDGTVSSLVAAENYFATFTRENGIKEGFLKVCDDETIIFRSGPIKAKEYFEGKEESTAELVWEPVFAKISKSGDWGFTSGPSIYRDSSVEQYGQYLSVWQSNRRGVWKLALDAGISHPKPRALPNLAFTDPKSTKYFKQRSKSRLQQREDLILTTDKLYSTTLSKNSVLAHTDFLAEETRLLFPGKEPILGKEAVLAFYEKNNVNVSSQAIYANRAMGSDLAYTYGTATVSTPDTSTEYHYVRIWENQAGKWNVLVEMFVE